MENATIEGLRITPDRRPPRNIEDEFRVELRLSRRMVGRAVDRALRMIGIRRPYEEIAIKCAFTPQDVDILVNSDDPSGGTLIIRVPVKIA